EHGRGHPGLHDYSRGICGLGLRTSARKVGDQARSEDVSPFVLADGVLNPLSIFDRYKDVITFRQGEKPWRVRPGLFVNLDFAYRNHEPLIGEAAILGSRDVM